MGWIAIGVGLTLSSAVSGAASAESLLVYSWADYISPKMIAEFEAETGLTVEITNYESVEIPETKLLAGGSGFDLVVTAGFTVPRLIQAGVLREIDRAALTNFGNLDPVLMEKLQKLDQGTRFSLPYAWGNTGLGINKAKVQEVLGTAAPLDTLALLFDPKNAEKLASCGIAAVDSPPDLLNEAMLYDGVADYYRPTDAEMKQSAITLQAIRPYIRYFDSVRYRQDLAEGAICIALGWNMDVGIASAIATDAGLPHAKDIMFIRPKEGAVVWADHFVIPADAKNPAAAERFLNLLLKPESAGEAVNTVRTSSPNIKAVDYALPELRDDPIIFPPKEWLQKQLPLDTFDLKMQRDLNRYFTAVKANEKIE